MPDSAISDLVEARQIRPTDNFVLEQDGIAKRLAGGTLSAWLLSVMEDHGGIHSVSLLSQSGLAKTYRMTFSDGTMFDYQVQDGRGISGITWSTSGTARDGQEHTGTINYNDGSTSTVKIYDGLKGDPGENSYIWVKYSSVYPTSDSDMTDIPSDYLGVYFGGLPTPPTSYLSYQWYKIKGDTGETGSPSILQSSNSVYAVSNSAQTIPQSTWSSSVPTVPQGSYLWTRTTLVFNSGEPVVFYTVSRHGVDGSGSVSSVNDVSPDGNGNVVLTASDISNGDATVAAQLNDLSSLVYQPGYSGFVGQLPAFGGLVAQSVATIKPFYIYAFLPKLVLPSSRLTVESVRLNMSTVDGVPLQENQMTDYSEYLSSTVVTGYKVELRFSGVPSGWTQTSAPVSGYVSLSLRVD